MVVIYCRFSPRKNASECESCEVQEAYCRQWCHDHDQQVRAVYCDKAVSGSTEIDARSIHDAIAALKKGDILLAHRRDRLARDLIVGLEIERAVSCRGASTATVEGEIFGASADPMTQLTKQILMVIAEFERRMIAQKTSAAMRLYQKRGRRMSSRCPFGWAQDPEDPARMVRDERAQSLIAQMLDMQGAGKGCREIARWLNANHADAKQTAWKPMDIWRILRREAK